MKKSESKPIKIGKITFRPNQTKNTINAVFAIPLIQILIWYFQYLAGMNQQGIQLFKITQQMFFKKLTLNCMRRRACNFSDLQFVTFPNLLTLTINHNHVQSYQTLQRINMPLLRKLNLDTGCCTTVKFLKKIDTPNLQVLSLNYNFIMDLNDYLPHFFAKKLDQLNAASYFASELEETKKHKQFNRAASQIFNLQWIAKKPFPKLSLLSRKNHSIFQRKLQKFSKMALKAYQNRIIGIQLSIF